MEKLHGSDQVNEVLKTSLQQIEAKHGKSAGNLAVALLMAFARYSKDDRQKDTRIAEELAQKVRDNNLLFNQTPGVQTFGWKDRWGFPKWLVELKTEICDPEIVFRHQTPVRRYTVDSELMLQMIIATSKIHEALGKGPVYRGTEVDQDDPYYRALHWHIRETGRNVSKILATHGNPSNGIRH